MGVQRYVRLLFKSTALLNFFVFLGNRHCKKAYLKCSDDDYRNLCHVWFCTDFKTSKREITKYKEFQIAHCVCWHVRCKLSRVKSKLHLGWISKRKILKSRDTRRLLENNRTIDVYLRRIDFTSRCNHTLHEFL